MSDSGIVSALCIIMAEWVDVCGLEKQVGVVFKSVVPRNIIVHNLIFEVLTSLFMTCIRYQNNTLLNISRSDKNQY